MAPSLADARCRKAALVERNTRLDARTRRCRASGCERTELVLLGAEIVGVATRAERIDGRQAGGAGDIDV